MEYSIIIILDTLYSYFIIIYYKTTDEELRAQAQLHNQYMYYVYSITLVYSFTI